jgi:adenine-specific DNA-methyltransferase
VKSRFLELWAEGRLWFGKDGKSRPRVKNYLNEVSGLATWTWWTHQEAGHNQEAKRELNHIMGTAQDSESFATPKPVRLLQRILQIATDQNSIVLDSFAGSGTTAHAVLKQNAEDGGDRRFVLVEMGDYADSLTAERVRRVIRGEGGQPTLGPETGFDFIELGEELLTESGDDVNPEIKRDELGRFVLFLESGIAAERVGENGTGYVGTGNGKDVYLYYAPDTTTTFGEEHLRALPEGEATRVVYADRCAVDEEELSVRGVVFRKIPRDVRDLVTRFNKDGSR